MKSRTGFSPLMTCPIPFWDFTEVCSLHSDIHATCTLDPDMPFFILTPLFKHVKAMQLLGCLFLRLNVASFVFCDVCSGQWLLYSMTSLHSVVERSDLSLSHG